LRQIYRNEGVLSGLYRGAVPSLLAIPQGTVQFAVYEWLKDALLHAPWRESPPQVQHVVNVTAETQASAPHNTAQQQPRTAVSPVEYFLAGAASKALACSTLYPYQVVRSRIVDEHAPTTSAWRALVMLIRVDGVVALWRGLGAQLLRVTPHSAIALVVYEMVMRQARLYFPTA